MKKFFAGFASALLVVAMFNVWSANDPINNIYTMGADVIRVDGNEVRVMLDNGHVYEFERGGLEVGYHINVMMHDNDTPRDVTDDYPLY